LHILIRKVGDSMVPDADRGVSTKDLARRVAEQTPSVKLLDFYTEALVTHIEKVLDEDMTEAMAAVFGRRS
jgi:hypothetical protein